VTERLYEQDAYLTTCEATITATTGDGIRLDRTVFYAQGGGQPGDTGSLRLIDGTALAVVDARKDDTGEVVHQVDPAALAAAGGNGLVGTRVTATIDWERRHRHMRMHTCLHLLGAVVGAPVTGGNLTAGKGRLDFDLPEASLDKEALTAELNALIGRDAPTTLMWISEAELDAQPELVRTLSVRPPRGAGRVRLLSIEGVDLQACGGTHVARTGEIGAVSVTKIEKKSRLNRRVSIAFA